MRVIVDVNTGEVKATNEEVILRAIAIGSCVVVAAYDSRTKTAAMAHVMLPGKAPESKSFEKTKYASDAIDEMLHEMSLKGSIMEDIEVCLVGGGNVLEKEDDTVCRDNINSTSQILREKNIPIKATVLGGTKRKGVFLNVKNGCVSYTEGKKEEKVLWKPSESGISK